MNFNSKQEADNVIEFVKDYYYKNNLKGAVIGISGGKDSAVVTAIFVKALGKENVVGVTLPCHSNEEDMIDAKKVASLYGIELINLDLTSCFDNFKTEFEKIGLEYEKQDLENSDINLKPRLRMSALYYVAAVYSTMKKGTYLVAGTSNKSELYVGYFTKGGDQVHDIEVISDFTVSEVIKVGEYLGVPKEILYKPPSDGLSGKTDEEKMGITYEDIEKYLYAQELSEEAKNKIAKMHNQNKHKFNIPAYKRERIGVFIGSFDPVHKGHTHIMSYLLQHGVVDKILVLPTGNYWDKTNISPLENRLDMLKYFENEKIEVSGEYNDLVITYQLFRKLKEKYSPDSLYLIIGADNIVNFDKWDELDELLEYHIIVVNRDNIDIQKYIDKFNKKDNFFVIDNFDYIPVSSTEIRENVDSKESIKYLDERVRKYIKEKGLYKGVK